MNYKHDIIKERFDILIETENQTKKFEFELDHNAETMFGVTVTSDIEELLYHRGSQKIQLNDQELFPENFESKLLMSGLGVSPNQRMVKVGDVKTGNKKIEVWFKDENRSYLKFRPYRVSFYFFSKVKCD